MRCAAVAAIALLAMDVSALASPAAETLAAPVPAAESRAEVIRAVIARLRAGYVFPDKVPAMEKRLHSSLADGRYARLGDEAFAAAVTEDLRAVSHDKHLGLTYSHDVVPPVAATAGPVDEAAWSRRLARRNFGFGKVEILGGNIGVLRISNFAPPQLAGSTLAAAMEFLRHTDALIIDLRANSGGSGEMVTALLSYLVEPGTHLNSFYNRRDGTTRQMWSAPLVPGGRFDPARPVFVVVDSDTFSAGEEAAYDLQALKRARIVGTKTGGGANPGRDERVGDHFELFVPDGRAINPVTGTNWEGSGVIPDVVADSAKAIQRAHLLALRAVLPRLDSERAKAETFREIERLETELGDTVAH